MLVNLAQWQTVRTSLQSANPSSSPSRRRKRDEGEYSKGFLAEASFVIATRRGHHHGKSRTTSGDHQFNDKNEVSPMLAVTSEHRISVIGQGRDESYQEHGTLQYSSRPGSAGAFFPISSSKASSIPLPSIASVVDTKNGWVYSLQQGNCLLCCWHVHQASGPDDKSALKVRLDCPALSMSFLPVHKGVLYGTCNDGRLFIARVTSSTAGSTAGANQISLDYLPSQRQNSTDHHVGTIAELRHGQPKRTNVGTNKKRKVVDANDGKASVQFYQIFCKGDTLVSLQRKVALDLLSSANDGTPIVSEEPVLHENTFDLSSTGGKMSKIVPKSMKLLISHSRSSPSSVVALAYEVQKGCEDGTTSSPKPSSKSQKDTSYRTYHYCVMLSLSSFGFSSHPVPLPSGSKHFGLIRSSMLAVATEQAILLVDLDTGSILHYSDIGQLIGKSSTSSSSWSESEIRLCADPKEATIALLFYKDDVLHVAFSKLRMDGSPAPTKLTLASKLEASTVAWRQYCPEGERIALPNPSNNLLDIGLEEGKASPYSSLDDTVSSSLLALKKVCDSIVSSDPGAATPSNVGMLSPLQTFDELTFDLLATTKPCEVDIEGKVVQHNPQDALPASGGRNGINGGTHSSPMQGQTSKRKRQQHLNGTHGHGHMHSHHHLSKKSYNLLPQTLIDGAVQILIEMLCKVQKSVKGQTSVSVWESKQILTRLVETGKVSARLHFSSWSLSGKEYGLLSLLRHLGDVGRCPGKSYMSPFKMIHTLLDHCQDLSERQLVLMLKFVLEESQPDDIAKYIIHANIPCKDHAYKTLSKTYLAKHNVQLKKKQPQKSNPSNNDADMTGEGENKQSNTDKSGQQQAAPGAATTRTGHKLILAGTCITLSRIIGYSECNEAFLRSALLEVFGSEREIAILAELFTEMFPMPSLPIDYSGGQHAASARSDGRQTLNVWKSACIWIISFCEAFHESLSSMKKKRGESYMKFLLRFITLANKQSEAIVSLSDELGRAMASNGNSNKSTPKENVDKSDRLQSDDHTSFTGNDGYSIDHIVI